MSRHKIDRAGWPQASTEQSYSDSELIQDVALRGSFSAAP